MKRLLILIIILCLVNVSTASGDFKVIPMNLLNDCFEKDNNPSNWINTTIRSRAHLWYYACSDIVKSDSSFDINWNDELPMAIMGTGDIIGTKGLNNTIYMYVRDINNLYRQVVICPERDYMIIEDSGISYKRAKEDVLYKAISCFELTDSDIQNEVEPFKKYGTAQNTTVAKTDKTQDNTKQKENNTSSTDNSSLPSLIGPFTGNTIKIKIGNTTYTIHKIFKETMDKYEAFFDAYIDFIKNTSAPNYWVKYSEMMNKYLETMESLDKLDKMTEKEKMWSYDETAYYTQVMIRINQKLYSALGTM